MSVSPVLQTSSGRAWPILSPSAADVHWPDIADALAKQCRFNGHCRLFYSVAEHCCRVAETLPPELRAYGLLHDAHEAIVGDVITPLKWAIRIVEEEAAGRTSAREAASSIATIAGLTDRAIWSAAGLPEPTPAQAGRIRHADLVLLATERRDLMAETRAVRWAPLPEPLATVIKPWPWPLAADQWLLRLKQFCPDIHSQIEEGACR